MKFEQLPFLQRVGLKGLGFTDKFLSMDMLARVEIKNLSGFYLFCLVASALSALQCAAFVKYILQAPTMVAVGSGLLWGYFFVYRTDTSLFDDVLSKTATRIYLILLSTVVFSMGTTYFFGKDKIQGVILEETSEKNRQLEAYNYDRYVKPYEERYATLTANRSGVIQELSKSDRGAKLGDASVVAYKNMEKALNDTSLSNTERRRIITTAQSSSDAVAYANKTYVQMMNEANKNVSLARMELDSAKKANQMRNEKEFHNPDYSVTSVLNALFKNYFDLGFMHLFSLVFVLFFEALPILQRKNYDTYEGVEAWTLYNRLPSSKIKHFLQILADLRAEKERIRSEYEEEKRNPKSTIEEKEEQIF